MSEFLAVYVQNALEFNEEILPRLGAGALPMRALITFCDNFRVAGIGVLFLSGTATEFHRRLQQSAQAFAHFLPTAEEEGKLASKCLPFFDAIASGDPGTAGEIAARAPRSWKQGEEYEEDFLFYEFLMQRFSLGASDGACAQLLERWELALKGSEDPRLAVCRSLQQRDSAAFGSALKDLLAERTASFERLADSDKLPPQVRDTEARLSVEGVALVRLADGLGLAIEPDYPSVPSVALEGSAASLDRESWRQIQ